MQRLKDAICELVSIAEGVCLHKDFKELDEAGAEIIDILDDLEEQNYVKVECRCKDCTHWIPVSEGLPEEYKTVLVTLAEGELRRTFFAYVKGGEWYHPLSKFKIGAVVKVIAWQALPEPYRESE